MKTLALCLVAFCWSGAVAAAPAPSTLNRNFILRVDSIAQQAIASGQTTGLVIAVANKDGVLFNRAYGQASLELNVPMATDTIFRIGSVSKQFTAAAILLLAEEGKLELDDKLSKYFPEFPRGGELSIRQLLNHTSGIRNFVNTLPSEAFRAGMPLPQLIKFIAGVGYDFDPGTDTSYSNSGFTLAGAIVEQVSGKAFRDFARERLFVPVGMPDTAVDLNEEIVKRRAAGYQDDPVKAGPFFLNALYSHMSVPFGAGAIRSTTADLVKWNAALYGGKLLKPASMQEMMTTPQLPALKPGAPERKNYGLGLGVGDRAGHAVFAHRGSIEGFDADLKYFPADGITLVTLANTQNGLAGMDVTLPAALFAVE